jgi:hypothetical protein
MTSGDTLKKCRKRQSHDDAILLVQYLVDRGGIVEKPNEGIAMDLHWMTNRGGGTWQVDIPRLVQARNHVKDGVDDNGKPCCGFRLNYRAAGHNRKGTELTLIDPTGSLGPHVNAVAKTVAGWMSREAQHHTENQREIETVERLGDHALALGDKTGYKLCARMSMEIEDYGTVLPKTMAEVMVWLDSLK